MTHIIIIIIVISSSAQIIRERLPEYPLRNGLIWNTAPGALLTLPTFTDTSSKVPFLLDVLNQEPGHNFTAVIFVQIGGGMFQQHFITLKSFFL